MTCREVVALMTDYLEGALTAAERLRFEEHIGGCDGCRAFLGQLRSLGTVLARLGAVPVPDPVRRELLAAFRDWKQAERR